MILNIKRK